MADPSKTEPATPRRREEARRRGQVVRSTELNTAVGILGSLLVLQFTGGHMLERLAASAVYFWGALPRAELDVSVLDQQALKQGLNLLLILLPLLIGVFLVGVLSNVLQIGLLVSPQALSLKLENLDPTRGLARIFSRRTVMELLKSLLKISLVALVAWWTLRARLPLLLGLMATGTSRFWNELAGLSAALIFRTGLTLLFLALLDYWYQRWEYEESLKMSKQEIKDEYKQLEGDPQVKARIRRLQQEAARRRMLAELPTADVVITNPVHLAVALKYDEQSMDAPKVVAKGARLVAERIKQVAREHRIPVLENKPLARALYESTPVGGQVPSPLFDAVAQLLAFVYQMQGRLEEKARRNRERLRRKGALVLWPAQGENRAL